jgi:hypothetical protein
LRLGTCPRFEFAVNQKMGVVDDLGLLFNCHTSDNQEFALKFPQGVASGIKCLVSCTEFTLTAAL